MYEVAVRLLGENGLKLRTKVGEPLSAATSIDPDVDGEDEPPLTAMLQALSVSTVTMPRAAIAAVVLRLLECDIAVYFHFVVIDRCGGSAVQTVHVVVPSGLGCDCMRIHSEMQARFGPPRR
jgi:hypothetical protein